MPEISNSQLQGFSDHLQKVEDELQWATLACERLAQKRDFDLATIAETLKRSKRTLELVRQLLEQSNFPTDLE